MDKLRLGLAMGLLFTAQAFAQTPGTTTSATAAQSGAGTSSTRLNGANKDGTDIVPTATKKNRKLHSQAAASSDNNGTAAAQSSDAQATRPQGSGPTSSR